MVQPPKPDQWVELKSPFVGYKTPASLAAAAAAAVAAHSHRRGSSRFSNRITHSRPATVIQGIEELDEKRIDNMFESDSHLTEGMLNTSINNGTVAAKDANAAAHTGAAASGSGGGEASANFAIEQILDTDRSITNGPTKVNNYNMARSHNKETQKTLF